MTCTRTGTGTCIHSVTRVFAGKHLSREGIRLAAVHAHLSGNNQWLTLNTLAVIKNAYKNLRPGVFGALVEILILNICDYD